MNWLRLFFFIFILHVEFCSSARIVAFFTVATKTHKLAAMPILEALADAGHQVTVISPFNTPKFRNVDEIVLSGAESIILDNDINWFQVQQMNPITQLATLLYSSREMFTQTYAELIREMVFPIIDHLKMPYILLCSMPNLGGLYPTIGTSNEYASVPAGLTDSTDTMSFFERFANMISLEVFIAIQDHYIVSMLDDLVHQDFPETRSIKEIAKDVSLIVVNRHPSFVFPRSLPPSVIPVSYLHTRPAKQLPKVISLIFI